MEKNHQLIHFTCVSGITEILIAELAEIGFDSFIETDEGFEASIQTYKLKPDDLNEALSLYKDRYNFNYRIENIEERNWNEEWEKNFDPVIVDNRCLIRASFHKPMENFPFEVVINPKMSFGTGHHDTTYLMVSNILELILDNKTVLDAGCGTGILSIVSEKGGAKNVLGFDIDAWAYQNALENIQLNNCRSISILQGTSDIIPENMQYDIVLANINRNIILQDFKKYVLSLRNNGILLLSGFLVEDIEIIMKEADNYKLELLKSKSRNQWLSLVFNKKSK